MVRPDPTHTVALYRLACADPAWTVDDAAERLSVTSEEIEAARAALTSLGLFSFWEATPSNCLVVDPSAACARLLAQEENLFDDYRERLGAVRGSLRQLIADYLGVESARRESISIETLTNRDQLDATLNNLTLLTRRETCALHPAPVPPPDSFDRTLKRIGSLVERGVRSRTIFLERFATFPHVAEYFRAATDLGAEIRLAPHLPVRMLLYDDNTAMLPIDPDESFAGALVIRFPSLVLSLQAFFENCWITATPLHATSARPEDQTLAFAPQQAAVLRMMAAGLKDDVIARRLGISSRTLSRIVAEVMERLEVTSRFEAGAKLAHLGWFTGAGESHSKG